MKTKLQNMFIKGMMYLGYFLALFSLLGSLVVIYVVKTPLN